MKFPKDLENVPFYSRRGRMFFYLIMNSNLSGFRENSDVENIKECYKRIEKYERDFEIYQVVRSAFGEEFMDLGPSLEDALKGINRYI